MVGLAGVCQMPAHALQWRVYDIGQRPGHTDHTYGLRWGRWPEHPPGHGPFLHRAKLTDLTLRQACLDLDTAKPVNKCA